ncbi:uncharacterized protein SETTUDRAFT_134923 [Exserohilum turcica Et28A]|uniref:Rhodopsin domain-containing protein n=1 Tax=Exserohilum turcicum (strain 28A) TaxID=671987 RepID=R0KBC8_EXST2|nr:uncharacterized protein SETTUDRAFT_134923 [Exserohilum turcica Et28A]EOA86674.1 hypothetical protein SETTUDRAFT_134923 [Exserohilum turcica Et28A]
MNADNTQEWPNQRLKVMIPMWTLLALSTIFLAWRIAYGFAQRRRFMLSDYLLIIAAILNIAAITVAQIVVDNGLGRHIQDPTVLPNIMTYVYYLWITQVLNIIAMAFLKWAICAWLLVLNFSRVYQAVIWLSILMVTALNFLAPVLTLFGCTPFERNWNILYKGKSHCWAKSSIQLSYTQGISNILTDVVYMAAPLIYLSRIQISRRTQWGIRAVFLLSIPATICSIFKTVELKTLTSTKDPTWDGLLPSTLTGSGKTPQYDYSTGGAAAGNSIQMNNFQGSKAYHSRIRGESVLDEDDESDRAILDDQDVKMHGIMKSTDVEVRISEAGPPRGSAIAHYGEGSSSNRSRSDSGGVGHSPKGFKEPQIDWSSPHIESRRGNGIQHAR